MSKKKDYPQPNPAAIHAVNSLLSNVEHSKNANIENGKAKAYIPIDRLHDYPDHPYKVLDDENMDALTQSILERGIITPILIRPWEHAPGEYDIIAGHRRVHAAQKAGLRSVPAFICNVSRDEAAIMVVDSNLHRERILPSERARAYKMWYDAQKRQGKRTDLTSSQVETKSRTDEEMATEFGESRVQIQRYLRLNDLIPELLDLMDEDKMALSVGVELSYLPDDLQYIVLGQIEELDCTPSYAQANHMHKEAAAGILTEECISEMMSAEKPNQKLKVTIPMEKLAVYFRQGTTPKDIQAYILKLLEEDRIRKARKRDRDVR
ncbi:MAG: ParB/RepB/Spo0J family partition protein [Clostridia bacterium]|nr:ParB/RepB/Spo0J family partition protein [Clostridia bacterium]